MSERRHRSEMLSVRFSDEELAALERKANGRPLSQVIREAVFGPAINFRCDCCRRRIRDREYRTWKTTHEHYVHEACLPKLRERAS